MRAANEAWALLAGLTAAAILTLLLAPRQARPDHSRPRQSRDGMTTGSFS